MVRKQLFVFRSIFSLFPKPLTPPLSFPITISSLWLEEKTMKKQNKSSLASIIMPVYNAGDFLVEAIESVKKQTYKNWELIAIDDGSTDNSLNVLKKYSTKDKRIKVFKTEHKGLSYALNLGLEKAKGEFIARMDADDINHLNRLETQLKFLNNHKNIILVGTQVTMVNEKGKVLAKKSFPLDHNEIYRMMAYMMPIQHATVMARTEYFKNIAYQNHTTAEDVSMFFKMILRGKVANLKENLYFYRLREESNSLKNLKKTYYLTLKSRIKAVVDWGYKPDVYGIIMNIIQFIIISLLPSSLVFLIYKFVRFNSFKLKNIIIRLRKKIICPISLRKTFSRSLYS